MTIAKVQKKFEELRQVILEDGKVDIVETYALLDFIEPYVKADNEKFVRFAELLKKCAEDKVITKAESHDIILAIDEVSRFLKLEAVVEYVFFGGLCGVAIIAGLALLVCRFLKYHT